MLIKSNEIEINEFLNLLSNQEITVYEDIQGTKIWCNVKNGKWEIRPKSINQNPINIIDLAVQKIYKYAYAYLLTIDQSKLQLIPENVYFCFEYFPDEQPANIKYDKLPLNRLILTCINKNNKYIYNFKMLKVYSNLLNVETLPILYSGKLNQSQLTAISNFISTDQNDLTFLNNDTNFAKYFYKLLNPNVNNSYLCNDFQSNLEKIIIRFEKNDKLITLDILNPLYTKNSYKTVSNHGNIYSILIFMFLDYLHSIDLDDYKLYGHNRELLYINLMCELFNDYIKLYKENVLQLDFVIPDFFYTDKFRINQSLISNELTLDIINEDKKLEYFLKIILTTFKEKNINKVGIFTDVIIKYLNSMIYKIHSKIEVLFNYNTNKSSYIVPNINDYENIKWEEDDKGYVKTKAGKLFNDGSRSNKKK